METDDVCYTAAPSLGRFNGSPGGFGCRGSFSLGLAPARLPPNARSRYSTVRELGAATGFCSRTLAAHVASLREMSPAIVGGQGRLA